MYPKIEGYYVKVMNQDDVCWTDHGHQRNYSLVLHRREGDPSHRCYPPVSISLTIPVWLLFFSHLRPVTSVHWYFCIRKLLNVFRNFSVTRRCSVSNSHTKPERI